MSAVIYGMREELYELRGNSRISYGIVVYDNTDEESTATILESIEDVTSDKEKLADLLEKCNALELSPEHLKDVVEDFILE